MKRASWLRKLLPMVCGGFVAGMTFFGLTYAGAVAAQGSEQPPRANDSTFAADIAGLKAVVPSQSHAMTDVGFQYANLWFAGTKKNWPLAQFYLDETRSHIRWTIRIRPVRKDPDGNDVNLQVIFDGLEGNVFKDVRQAIEAKDDVKFAAAYRRGLEGCYACHKASGKPYLRPMVPQVPPQPIMNFDPDATWP